MEQKQELNTDNYYEIAEMIRGRPVWIVRWSGIIYIAVFLFTLTSIYWIRYPDVVTVPVRVYVCSLKEKGINYYTTINICATSKLHFSKSSELEMNQVAFVKLSNYQNTDIGEIRVQIESIERAKNDSFYIVNFKLVDRFKETFNKTLNSQSEIFGTVELHTNKKNLFSRILN